MGDRRYEREDPESRSRIRVAAVLNVIGWLEGQEGATMTCMSGSGATCFALFESDETRDAAAVACPNVLWHLASTLR